MSAWLEPADTPDALTRRFVDRRTQAVTVRLSPGGHYVTREADEMIATVLGSCVAACIRDPVAGIGGMNHFMLPTGDPAFWDPGNEDLRYGNFAMARLIGDIIAGGGKAERLEIKIFGGGNVNNTGATVGLQNASFAEAYLRGSGFAVAAAHLRGEHARRVHYFPLTGVVLMREMPRLHADHLDTLNQVRAEQAAQAARTR